MAGKRGGRGKPSAPRLERLGRQFEGIMRADLKGAFSTFAKGVDYDAMADAVYSGDYRRVFATLPMDELPRLLTDGMQGAGQALVRANAVETDNLATMLLPEGGRGPDQSLLPTIDNDRVLDYVGTRTGELIQNVTADLQTHVQNAVAVGMTNYLSPRQVAGLIRDGLPLNNRQQGALNKYTAGLAATNLPKKRQIELTERYRNALTDQRATTIARTETQYAVNFGQTASWDEAQRQGLIGYRSLVEWVTEQDPCEKICRPMAGVRRLINEPFTLPNGAVLMHPPAHVACRCQCRLLAEG